MKAIELEVWVTRLLDATVAGRPNEDFRVEFKREWPADHHAAARRLAGHANAARGERILWLVGVDDSGAVVGARREDMANWWPQVERRFDDVAPSLVRDMNVAYEGKTVVALLFDTDRAPFVVNASPPQGPMQREIPWREGTQVRSARRIDVIRLLSPLVTAPDVEATGGELAVIGNDAGDDFWRLDLQVFVNPAGRNAIHLPVSGIEARIIASGVDALTFDLDAHCQYGTDDGYLDDKNECLSITSPTRIAVSAGGNRPRKSAQDIPLRLSVSLARTRGAAPLRLDIDLHPIGALPGSNVDHRWIPVL